MRLQRNMPAQGFQSPYRFFGTVFRCLDKPPDGFPPVLLHPMAMEVHEAQTELGLIEALVG